MATLGLGNADAVQLTSVEKKKHFFLWVSFYYYLTPPDWPLIGGVN